MRHVHELRDAKLFIVAIVCILVMSQFVGDALWPFHNWNLYSEACHLPSSVTQTKIYILDIDEKKHVLSAHDWFSIDDIDSEQPGRHVFKRMLKKSNDDYLLRRAEELIQKPVFEVSIWNIIWNTDFTTHPPITTRVSSDRKYLHSVQWLK